MATLRSQLIWQRLAGIFGADALERKFGKEAPPEWIAAISELTQVQLDHGLAKLLQGGGAHVPSLPVFIAACRDAREFARSAPNQTLEDKRFDGWAAAGNKHLLALCMRRAMRSEGGFDAAQTALLVAAKNAWAQTMRDTAENGEVDIETQLGLWKFHVDTVVANIDHAA